MPSLKFACDPRVEDAAEECMTRGFCSNYFPSADMNTAYLRVNDILSQSCKLAYPTVSRKIQKNIKILHNILEISKYFSLSGIRHFDNSILSDTNQFKQSNESDESRLDQIYNAFPFSVWESASDMGDFMNVTLYQINNVNATVEQVIVSNILHYMQDFSYNLGCSRNP